MTCFRCQKQGHRAAECRATLAEIEHEGDDEDDAVFTGGITWVGSVEVEETCSPCWTAGSRIATRNTFETLADEDFDEESGEHCQRDIQSWPEFEPREKSKRKDKMPAVKKWKKAVDLEVNALEQQVNELENAKKKKQVRINTMEQSTKKHVKVTVDSGAEDSVWPTELVDNWDKAEETEQSKNGKGFIVASGQRIPNHGRLKVGFGKDKNKKKGMAFHVTDVKKPLAAVCKNAETTAIWYASDQKPRTVTSTTSRRRRIFS
jgi:hypothetical protein